MAGKLDQALDEIVKTNRQGRGRGRGGRRVGGRPTANGDVKMTDATSRVTKPSAGRPRTVVNKAAVAAATIPSAPRTSESKIIVSGLPADVSEVQIQEYFAKTIGPVKKVFLTYGPNGQSKGVATIVFKQATSAHDAATKLNGVKVDNRAMRIEVVLGANQAPVPAGLGDRIKPTAKPAAAKAQPKSAAAKKQQPAAKAGKAKRGRNAGRPKAKTAEELDAEMTDYFVPKDAAAPATNGTAATNGVAAPSGDAAMNDEIM